MRLLQLSRLEMVVCVVGALAGLIPLVEETLPFHGLTWGRLNREPYRITGVEANSPAAASGFRVDDLVLAIEGQAEPPDDFAGLLSRLQPGDSIRFKVKRGGPDGNPFNVPQEGKEVKVTATAEPPQIASVYYLDLWQPIAGAFCVALGLLLFITEPLRPRPRWRAGLVLLVGIGLAVGYFILIASGSGSHPWSNLELRHFRTRSGGFVWHFGQSWLGLLTGLALMAFGALDLRERLWRQVVERQATPEPRLSHPEDETAIMERNDLTR